MNRVDRLFGILLFLQSKKYIQAGQIAEKFGISVRTVYRDIKALNEQGVPLSFEQNKGYFVVQGYFLPPVSFSSDEANALLLVEQIVNGFADNSIRKHYATALSKVRSVLKTSQKESLENLDNNILMQLPSRPDQDFGYLSTLQQAISARKIIEIDYKNNNGEFSKRCVEPIGLVFYAFSWHLIGWCHLRSSYRDFKISRLEAVRIQERGFQKEDHMAMSDYMKQLPVSF
ncbi:helix-turn-helix transcriptional regulator [Hufsiella ginkgonis]|uniref:WYL domain-containing protein n=1 Tax=Hufsiella ginkgonis TaxID=2695274 RepID=A0A7K1XZN2_9SPHI|nr:YafY family protein [Hufsiella ginkgonis]MXV16433.1 WYL domain-containing protein [Hufsiella ginkgonis]